MGESFYTRVNAWYETGHIALVTGCPDDSKRFWPAVRKALRKAGIEFSNSNSKHSCAIYVLESDRQAAREAIEGLQLHWYDNLED